LNIFSYLKQLCLLTKQSKTFALSLPATDARHIICYVIWGNHRIHPPSKSEVFFQKGRACSEWDFGWKWILLPYRSGFKSYTCSYARAVSCTKRDTYMCIKSMMSSKVRVKLCLLNLKFYFHPIDRAKSCNFGFNPLW
jgi:hypothetical protein